jgi:hypothetical protein
METVNFDPPIPTPCYIAMITDAQGRYKFGIYDVKEKQLRTVYQLNAEGTAYVPAEV